MELMRIIAACVLCLPLILLVKKAAPEQSFLLSLAVVLAAVFTCIAMVSPAVEHMKGLFSQVGLEGRYIAILLRTLAAALVTKLGADICRDGGGQALAGVVELAGASASIMILLPLLEAVVELLLGYFT